MEKEHTTLSIILRTIDFMQETRLVNNVREVEEFLRILGEASSSGNGCGLKGGIINVLEHYGSQLKYCKSQYDMLVGFKSEPTAKKPKIDLDWEDWSLLTLEILKVRANTELEIAKIWNEPIDVNPSDHGDNKLAEIAIMKVKIERFGKILAVLQKAQDSIYDLNE